MIQNEYIVRSTFDDHCRITAWYGIVQAIAQAQQERPIVHDKLNGTIIAVGAHANNAGSSIREYLQSVLKNQDVYALDALRASHIVCKTAINPHLRSALSLLETGSTITTAGQDLGDYLSLANEYEVQAFYRDRILAAVAVREYLPPAVFRYLREFDMFIGSEVSR